MSDQDTQREIPKTQQEWFNELVAARHLADLAQLGVENKMREIAEKLGKTFENEGYHPDFPGATYIQIRVRYSNSVGRDVPYFVPLSTRKRQNRPKVVPSAPLQIQKTSALLQIQEPRSTGVTEVLSTGTGSATTVA